jgi:hypothetical protein
MRNEWSGLLFYKIEGSINKPESIVITPEFIHLMDIGSSTYTEYDMDETVLEAFDVYPDAMRLKMGHIHSHNTMGVFFSGTDMDELIDNSDGHHVYFSLIVNNAGDVDAKLAINIETEETITGSKSVYYTIDDFNGKPIVQKKNEKYADTVKTKHVYVVDMEVKFEVVEYKNPILSILSERFKEVKKIKEDKQKAKTQYLKTSEGFYQPKAQTGWQQEWENEMFPNYHGGLAGVRTTPVQQPKKKNYTTLEVQKNEQEVINFLVGLFSEGKKEYYSIDLAVKYFMKKSSGITVKSNIIDEASIYSSMIASFVQTFGEDTPVYEEAILDFIVKKLNKPEYASNKVMRQILSDLGVL